MESRFVSIIALAGALALPITATAAGTSPTPSSPPSSASAGSSSLLKSLDTNNDGSVSRDEAKKSTDIDKRFGQLDLDRDGKLSQAELNAVSSPAAGGTPPKGSMSGSTTPSTPK
jgi:tRNA A37 threonylcarbamoyladenosine synthetase subunit TsaC/SUA5/YrdC